MKEIKFILDYEEKPAAVKKICILHSRIKFQRNVDSDLGKNIVRKLPLKKRHIKEMRSFAKA